MGIFTILSGLTLALFLPDSFAQPRSWLLPRRNIFSERDLYILRARVLLDDPLKAKKGRHLPLAAFKRAFTNWRLLWAYSRIQEFTTDDDTARPHVMITLCNNGPLTAFGAYTPTIIVRSRGAVRAATDQRSLLQREVTDTTNSSRTRWQV